jgi:hypothetical protein
MVSTSVPLELAKAAGLRASSSSREGQLRAHMRVRVAECETRRETAPGETSVRETSSAAREGSCAQASEAVAHLTQLHPVM